MLSINVFKLVVFRIGELIVEKKHGSIKFPHNRMYFYLYYK